MSNIPTVAQLSMESFPNNQELQPLVNALNLYIRQVNNILKNNVNITDNLAAQTRTVTFRSTAGGKLVDSSSPITFPSTLQRKATHLICTQCYQTGSPFSTTDILVFPSWQDVNGVITINSLGNSAGVLINTQYTATFLVL